MPSSWRHMEQVLDPVSETLRSGLSRRVHGRAAGAVGQGNPPADGGHEEPSPACRLRVRTGPARPRSSCSASRWRVGGRRPPGPGVRRWTGRWRSPACWKDATPNARRFTLVCDHLNTHTKGAFYEVFEPARARELVRRIEFCHTPKHGSWLNIAENELSSMTRRCVRGRRIGDLGTLHGRSVGVVHRRQWHATRCRLADEGRRCAL